MPWQQSARVGIALAGGACAVAVLASIGSREAPVPPAAPERLDPSAVIESAGATLRQLQPATSDGAGRREYTLDAARHFTYEDGTTRFSGGVRAAIRDDEGPDFTVTAAEAAMAGEGGEVTFEGDVVVDVPGGFRLTAGGMVVGLESGLLTTEGPTTFAREGFSGEGTGLVYDTGRDTLVIEADAEGALGADTGTPLAFSATRVTFDRARRFLGLAGAVEILRAGDRLAAERVDVTLDEGGERATAMALRGGAGVTAPGGALEAMTAEDIDLAYSPDGARLERVNLNGNADVRLAADADAPAGRAIRGAGIQVTLDGTQALARIEAAGDVALALPTGTGPAFRVSADGVDARAVEGTLREAGFVGGVTFAEDGADAAGARRVTAERLLLQLAAGTVELAIFTGGSRLEADGIVASGPEIHYRPGNASLSLRGTAVEAPSRIVDDRITVEAASIDATLEDLFIAAEGRVQTTLLPPGAGSGSRLPGLLDEGAAVNVSAARFEYERDGGAVTYAGGAVLWQGDTTIRGESLVLDQASGDFQASGAAQSTLQLDGETSVGLAPVIRYRDAAREVTYSGPDGPVVPGPPDGGVRLGGPQGDLTAGGITVRLGEGSGVTALEAVGGIRLLLDTRTATGVGLRYDAEDATYTLTGAARTPATLLDGCRRTEGRSLLFEAAGDRVVVDGNEEVRTRTAGTPCGEPAAP